MVAHMVKNLAAMQETWVQSLGLKDPLEKGMAAHSSILAWRIPWTEDPDGLQSIGSQRVGYDWLTNAIGFSGGSMVKNPPASAGDVRDMSPISGLGKSPWVGNGVHVM